MLNRSHFVAELTFAFSLSFIFIISSFPIFLVEFGRGSWASILLPLSAMYQGCRVSNNAFDHMRSCSSRGGRGRGNTRSFQGRCGCRPGHTGLHERLQLWPTRLPEGRGSKVTWVRPSSISNTHESKNDCVEIKMLRALYIVRWYQVSKIVEYLTHWSRKA